MYVLAEIWTQISCLAEMYSAMTNVSNPYAGMKISSTDIAEGGALSHKNDMIDIYSNSWGPSDNGCFVSGPEQEARMALEMGVKEVIDI